MATAAETSHHFPRSDDVETASIHSEAPSYVSEAPSYHTIASQPEPIPPYTPPGTTATSHSTNVVQPGAPDAVHPGQTSAPARTSTSSSQPRTTGLPPIPPRCPTIPQLDQFRIPTWSAIQSNPTYHNVARRRARGNAGDPVASLRRAILLERVAESENTLLSSSPSSSSSSSLPSSSSCSSQPGSSSAPAPRRPLEDPHLVGEAAAAEARRARLARERANEILVQEDRQWNWFVTQMGDWEERDRSWTRSRREIESGQRPILSRRLAGN
ncbi:hypothetical protein ACRALDRAFT_2040702 [Sodiomyces alcalophilus JCM 7366]|uniref:uncharacterized protein n=1 Tax=Sodiomyces alcalophilus JCM 7366 TaxID=591952 RepID=UPI0039B53B27